MLFLGLELCYDIQVRRRPAPRPVDPSNHFPNGQNSPERESGSSTDAIQVSKLLSLLWNHMLKSSDSFDYTCLKAVTALKPLAESYHDDFFSEP